MKLRVMKIEEWWWRWSRGGVGPIEADGTLKLEKENQVRGDRATETSLFTAPTRTRAS